VKTLHDLALAAQSEEQFLRVQRIAARERLNGSLDRLRGTVATAASPMPWIRRYPRASAAIGIAGVLAMAAAVMRRTRRMDCGACADGMGRESTLESVGSSLWGVARRAAISALTTKLLWPIGDAVGLGGHAAGDWAPPSVD